MSLDRLQQAWRRSDRLFGMLSDEAWLQQPIALRQPFLFYLGHLPAFAWRHLGRGLLGRAPFCPELDLLFERGIDPTGVDSYEPQDVWPDRGAVLDYRNRVRTELILALSDPRLSFGFEAPPEGSAERPGREAASLFAMVVEHELMHHETLAYMLQELDHGLKQRPADWPELPGPGVPQRGRRVELPAGEVVMGALPGSLPFGWDNEYPAHRVPVPAFAIDDLPVTNAEFAEFVDVGGYAEGRLWRPADWGWRSRLGLRQPHAWRRHSDGWRVRGLLEDVPFETAAQWPAMVSWAEASAYARWRESRLPTEAEWHRAAGSTPDGNDRRWPWGDDPPSDRHGNFRFRHASPVPVGSHPQGASAWGVHELVGNGWEWTSSPFAPFPGFTKMEHYPGYSADFFDDSHFVLLGASWATDETLLRPSFRNWFQPHYPFVFSKFRCARSL
jgi:ergothioneine biosynthesis protein EgtB